jgi:hypothetical protein
MIFACGIAQIPCSEWKMLRSGESGEQPDLEGRAAKGVVPQCFAGQEISINLRYDWK